jgi:hypothetical protein
MILQVLINRKGDTIENEIESEVSAEQTAYAWGGFSPRSGSVLLHYHALWGGQVPCCLSYLVESEAEGLSDQISISTLLRLP